MPRAPMSVCSLGNQQLAMHLRRAESWNWKQDAALSLRIEGGRFGHYFGLVHLGGHRR